MADDRPLVEPTASLGKLAAGNSTFSEKGIEHSHILAGQANRNDSMDSKLAVEKSAFDQDDGEAVLLNQGGDFVQHRYHSFLA